MTTDTPSVSPALQPLIGFGDLKVWSVLVTILGDLAAEDGATVSGPALSALTARMAIRPEALRVALHRLRKDGWVQSQKFGRISLYALTAQGLRETQAVQARVYAASRPKVPSWFLVALPPDTTAPPHGLPLGHNFWLMDRPPTEHPGALVAEVMPGAFPEWVLDAGMPPPLQRVYTAWLATLMALPPAPSDPLDRLAMRILALHHWRRIVLKHSALAAAIQPPTWAGAECRQRMAQLLADLPRQSL
jgi:phenylacetic acid degradation operon negative regulatory protein